MFYSAEKRKAYLDELKKNSTPIKEHPFEYDGNPRHKGKVFKIRLDHLIFNQFNARIADELKTYQASALGEDHEYNEALEDKIKDILWSQGGKNKETEADLKKKGQLEPGVVTADGVIVSGNRRAMLLSRLNQEYFEGVILDEAYDGNKTMIVRLEASLQHRVVGSQEYGATAKQFAVYTMKEDHKLECSEIAEDMNETIPKVKQYYDEMKTMLEYLKIIGTPHVYTNLRIQGNKGTKEETFRETNKHYNKMIGDKASLKLDWGYTEEDADKYKEIMYDYIRAYNLGAPALYRRIGPGTIKQKGILSNQVIFNDFYEEHKKITNPVTEKLESFEEYADQPENDGLDPKQIADKRESKWIKDVGEGLLKNYQKYVEKIDALHREVEPEDKINKALSNLEGISSDDLLAIKESPNLENVLTQLNSIQYHVKGFLEKINKD